MLTAAAIRHRQKEGEKEADETGYQGVQGLPILLLVAFWLLAVDDNCYWFRLP